MVYKSQYIIYCLIDPRNGNVRYIGKSTSGMRRPREHAYYARHGSPQYCARWIRSLQALNLNYQIVVLQELSGAAELDEWERWWITFARAWGCRLTNHTDGGGGLLGYVHSAAARASIGAKNRVHMMGRRQSAETIAKRTEKLHGHTCSAATREKLRAANKGRRLTPEHRAKLSAAARNRSPEAREHAAAAQRGKTHSIESRRKIAAANTGRRPTPETLEKLSAWQRGKPKSKVHRAKISVALMGRRLSAVHRAKLSAIRLGHSTSSITRAKLSAALRGRVVPAAQRDRSWVVRRALECARAWGCAL